MKITVAKYAGFCKGVSRAIGIAVGCAGGCCTLGRLIHNEQVLAELEKRGIYAIQDPSEANGKTVVIRSHGVPKAVCDSMDKTGIPYVDATCVFVKKIHKIVSEYDAKGYQILIAGNPEHPEVIGINGWCRNRAIILSGSEIPPLDPDQKYCLVSQTTFDYRTFQNIIKKIEKLCKTVVIHNTICYTTISRQSEADNLSKICDCMLVIGSKTSSNTRKLFEICKQNCNNTIYVPSVSELHGKYDFSHTSHVGIVAGASTPPQSIEETVAYLHSLEQGNPNI